MVLTLWGNFPDMCYFQSASLIRYVVILTKIETHTHFLFPFILFNVVVLTQQCCGPVSLCALFEWMYLLLCKLTLLCRMVVGWSCQDLQWIHTNRGFALSHWKPFVIVQSKDCVCQSFRVLNKPKEVHRQTVLREFMITWLYKLDFADSDYEGRKFLNGCFWAFHTLLREM